MVKVGDRVRLANGKKELEVVHIVRNYVTAAYLKNGKLPGWDYERSTKTLPQQSFVLFNEKENEMTNKLFQTKEEKPRYGTFLAKNSKGETVLDMKGTGVPEAFGKNEIEEVLPYTIKDEGRGRDN